MKKIISLFIFLFVFSAHAVSSELIDQKTLDQIQSFSEVEKSIIYAEKHTTQFVLQTNNQGDYLRTDRVFVIFHGLYNSPFFAKDMQNFLVDKFAQNTVTVRLSHHFEKNRKNLDKVKLEDWVYQLEDLRPLLHQLGNKLVLVGHSTGGLLALYTTFKDSKNIEALLLFAPAIELTRRSINRAKAGVHLGTGISDLKGRYASPYAALEVNLLGKVFRDAFVKSQQALNARVLIVDTETDKTIKIDRNKSFLEELSWRGDEVQYELLSRSENISHSKIMDKKSSGLSFIEGFLNNVTSPLMLASSF